MRPKYITLTTRLITVKRMINAENPTSFYIKRNKAGNKTQFLKGKSVNFAKVSFAHFFFIFDTQAYLLQRG